MINVLPEQEDAKGRGQARQNQALIGVQHIPRPDGLEVGDNQHLPGDHHGGHHKEKHHFLCPEGDKHNGIGCQQREHDLQRRGEYAYNRGVEHVVEQGLGLKGVDVVCEVE